jgi:hypothetical protein
MEILWYVIVFYFGAIVGFLLRIWWEKKAKYSGTIFVTHEEQKTLYSLELNDYPESIELKKQVVFKVDASEENLDRK